MDKQLKLQIGFGVVLLLLLSSLVYIYSNMIFSLPLFGDATIHAGITKDLMAGNMWNADTTYPFFYNSLQGSLYMLYGDRGFNAIIFLGILLLSMSIYLLTYQLTKSRTAGIVCAILVVISPKIIFYSSRLYMEIVLSAFFVLSVFYFAKFLETQSSIDLSLTAFFVGVSASIKQQGLFILFPAILLTFVTLLCVMYFGKRLSSQRTFIALKQGLLFVLIFVVTIASFYLALMHMSGNLIPSNGDSSVINLTNDVGRVISGYSENPVDVVFNEKWAGRFTELETAYYDIGAVSGEQKHIWPLDPITSKDGFLKANSLYLTNFWNSGVDNTLIDVMNLLLCYGIVVFIYVVSLKKSRHDSKWTLLSFGLFILVFLIINYYMFGKNSDQMRYHLFIPIILAVFIIFGLLKLFDAFIRLMSRKTLAYLVVVAILILMIPAALMSTKHDADLNLRWKNSQIYAPSKGGVYSIQLTGAWLQNHTEPGSMTWQNCGNELHYYSEMPFYYNRWVMFLNRSELSEMFKDKGVNYVVIFDSQVVNDAKWNNFCNVPKSFVSRINSSFPLVYQTPAGDIKVYFLNSSKLEAYVADSMQNVSNLRQRSSYDFGRQSYATSTSGRLYLCKVPAVTNRDDLWSADNGSTWSQYGAKAPVSFAVRIDATRSGVAATVPPAVVANSGSFPIDKSRSAIHYFDLVNHSAVTSLIMNVKLAKRGNPQGNLTIRFNGVAVAIAAANVPSDSSCSGAVDQSISLPVAVMREGRNELIFQGNPSWDYSDDGGLHGYAERIMRSDEENQFIQRVFDGHKYSNGVFDVNVGLWPKNYSAAFNLNFDDTDCLNLVGYQQDPENSQIGQLRQLFKSHPELQVTLFYIPDHIMPGDSLDRSITSSSCRNNSYILKSLSSNIEIADHGLEHVSNNKAAPYIEFEYSTKDEIEKRLSMAQSDFISAGFKVTGVRPPGWGVGLNLSLIDAAKDLHFKYIAANAKTDGLNYDMLRVSGLYPVYYDGILNIPQTGNWLYGDYHKTIDYIVDKQGMISFKGHFYDESNAEGRTYDGLTVNRTKKMDDILTYVESGYPDKIWFAKMDDIATFWNAKRALVFTSERVSPNEYSLKIDNPSDYDARDVRISTGTQGYVFTTPGGDLSDSQIISIGSKNSTTVKVMRVE